MAVDKPLKAPFPYFGGKSKMADPVWRRFGIVRNYVEPFFGSGAMLLGRPLPFDGVETVNDLNGMLANFWRALQADPEGVAHHADWPVNENDLHARHAWLVGQMDSLQSRLEGDTDYFDVKIAGWWVWGQSCWIGSNWCTGKGPWRVSLVDGIKHLTRDSDGCGITRNRPHLGDSGNGVNRQLPHLSTSGHGVHKSSITDLLPWMNALSDRLRRVRVCCGDWSRVISPSVTTKHGLTAVFLDPPYADTAGRASALYSSDSETVAHDVREWCISNGDNPLLHIALCGYEGEHQMPDTWECLAWKTNGGMGNQKRSGPNLNATKERIWFSPHCLKTDAETPLLWKADA